MGRKRKKIPILIGAAGVLLCLTAAVTAGRAWLPAGRESSVVFRQEENNGSSLINREKDREQETKAWQTEAWTDPESYSETDSYTPSADEPPKAVPNTNSLQISQNQSKEDIIETGKEENPEETIVGKPTEESVGDMVETAGQNAELSEAETDMKESVWWEKMEVCTVWTEGVNQVFQGFQNRREELGYGRLEKNSAAMDTAQDWANEMAEGDRMYHSSASEKGWSYNDYMALHSQYSIYDEGVGELQTYDSKEEALKAAYQMGVIQVMHTGYDGSQPFKDPTAVSEIGIGVSISASGKVYICIHIPHN